MSSRPKLTLTDLLLSLRRSLIQAIEDNDHTKLQALKITFGNLVEEVYASEDKTLIGILVAFEDAARDALTGVPWKSDLPSAELLVQALD